MSARSSLPLLVAVCLACLVPAADAPAGRRERAPAAAAPDGEPARPKSRAALAAIARHEKAVQAAEREYNAAVRESASKLVGEFEAAMKAALKAENLDEATALRDAIAAAKAPAAGAGSRVGGRAVAPGAPGGKGKTFTIHAAGDWQPTITVRRGQRVRIGARGEWCGHTDARAETTCGPGGIIRQAREEYHLIAQIGRESGRSFKVGYGVDFTADRDGVLMMGFQGDHATADGSVEVMILGAGR